MARAGNGLRAQAGQAYAQIEHELKSLRNWRFRLFPGGVRHHAILQENNILCQGGDRRPTGGLLCLGVTTGRSISNELLFERFCRRSRRTTRYRHRHQSDQRERSSSTSMTNTAAAATQVANVITYRGRIAVRDMARTLGFAGATGRVEQADAHWNARPSDIDDPRAGDRPGRRSRIHGTLGIHSGGHGDLRPPDRRCLPSGMGAHGNRSVLQWTRMTARQSVW
jgi:error-prone DNA polymerase